MVEKHFSYPHSEDSNIFCEALAYSEADTGFTGFLIEKDYYCSLILRNLFESNTALGYLQALHNRSNRACYPPIVP
jgi:hypothetical protein